MSHGKYRYYKPRERFGYANYGNYGCGLDYGRQLGYYRFYGSALQYLLLPVLLGDYINLNSYYYPGIDTSDFIESSSAVNPNRTFPV